MPAREFERLHRQRPGSFGEAAQRLSDSIDAARDELEREFLPVFERALRPLSKIAGKVSR